MHLAKWREIMQTIKIEGSIIYDTESYIKGYKFLGIPLNSTYWERYPTQIFVAPYIIEIEAPDDVENMIYEKTLTSLQTQRKLILAENESRIKQIDQQIQEHLAIEA